MVNEIKLTGISASYAATELKSKPSFETLSNIEKETLEVSVNAKLLKNLDSSQNEIDLPKLDALKNTLTNGYVIDYNKLANHLIRGEFDTQ